jgi:PEP-CTERM motif-containing protein
MVQRGEAWVRLCSMAKYFDLYNTALKKGDEDVTEFAPFSHDAESRAATPLQRVPEPNTVTLLATGGLGLLAALKRSRPL